MIPWLCFAVFVAAVLLALRALQRNDWLMLAIYLIVGAVAAVAAIQTLPMAVGH